MKKVCVVLSAAALMLTALTPATASAAPGNVKITDHPYVRYDGGTDPAIERCSTSNLLQDEPTVTIAPHNTSLMTAGSNDYCAVTVFGGSWMGFHYSTDAGRTWTNSLLPGYPSDTSTAGRASPLFGIVNNQSDPAQAWDNEGHLYYVGIGFNRGPLHGAVFVARYTWESGPKPTYDFTTLPVGVTPLEQFDDKTQLEVDRGVNSPHAGNVYACWVRFKNFKNTVQLARSTDGGRTFTTQAISGSTELAQFCDIAVTRNGDVHVAWRRFVDTRSDGTTVGNAVEWTKSTDGGATFSSPRVLAPFTGWDPTDMTLDPVAYGQAKLAYCQSADGTRGGCNSGAPRATAGDCGDGPFTCKSGYVFARNTSQVRIAADPTKHGRNGEVYVVYDASVPGSETPTGTTYGSVGTPGPGIGSQGAIYLLRTDNGGQHWSSPARLDPQRKGHQFFADITADAGKVHAVWQDSRSDQASGPPSTPSGGDFRTVPISNRWVSANPPGGVSTGPGIDTYYATSSNGKSWKVRKISTVPTMPQYELLGNRDAAFLGDYNFIAASGKTVLMAWTDHRDVVPGTDPRYPADGTDGFDILQCRAQQPDGTYGPDTCPFDGGNDQNIYGAVIGR